MANLFSWSADSIPPSGYEQKAGSSINTSEKIEGTGSMQQVCNGTQRDQGIQENNGFAWQMSFGNKYYNRCWMKMQSSGWAYSNQDKFKACRWGRDGDVIDFMTGYFGAAGVWPGEHSLFGFTSDQGAGSGGDGPTISYDFDPTSNSTVTDWFEMIVLFHIQSAEDEADGRMALFVNGVLEGELTGVRWFTGADTDLFEKKASFMCWQFPQDVDGTFWIDDVSVDTTWNSTTYSDPDAGDTTPPSIDTPDAGTPTSSGTVGPSFNTNEANGNGYCAVVTNTGSCTDDQLIAGSGGNIVAGATASKSITTTGTQTFGTISSGSVNPSTLYQLKMLHRDAAGNKSSPQLSVDLTTTAASQQSVLLLDDFEVDSIAAPPTGNYYEIDTSGLTRSQVEAVSGTWSLRHANMSQSASLWAGFGKLPANTSWPAFAQAPSCSTTAIYRDITVQFKHKFTGWTSGGSAPDGWKLLRISCFAGETGAQAAVLHLWNSDTNVVRLMFDPATGVSGSTLLTTEWNDFANLTFLGGQKMLTDFYVAGNLDTWFDFKVRMKLNDPGQSNGVMQLWIDDVEITEMTATNLNYIGSYATFGINTVHLERYANSGGSATDVSYFDDLTIIDNEAEVGQSPRGSMLGGLG